MQLVNNTPFDVFVVASQLDPPRPSATLVVKGTFSIVPDTVAEPVADDEQEQVKPDEPHMDEIGRSLAWSNDMEPQKPFAEVLVYGDVHAPGGAPVPAMQAAVRIGEWEKRIAAFGDRIWVRGPDGIATASEPLPFSSIPLRWEFAFGGLDDVRNPMGRGIDTEIEIRDGVRGIALPNIEAPDALITSPQDRPEPVGLGPIPTTFEGRYRKMGTRDRRWATFRAPLPPDDFDVSYHNAAPEDQQFDGPFKGDEIVEIEGLHPLHGRFRFQLPGIRLRAFLVRTANGEQVTEETPLHIDTLAITPDEDRLVMIWRGYAAVDRHDFSDVAGMYLAQEDLAAPPRASAGYIPEIGARITLPGVDGPDQAEIDAEVDRALGEAKGLLQQAQLPDDLRARMMAETDPQRLFDMVAEELKRQSDGLMDIARKGGP